MSEQEFSRPPGVRVTYRRMKFQFEEGFERYWLAGSAFRSLFYTQLSAAFQPGERFFIESARAMKGHIEDPRLTEELAEFVRQEGHHTAQHLKFDRMNEQMGLDIRTCRDRYARSLKRARSPLQKLGTTCAIEHFTSSFADLLFCRPEIAKGADPSVLALWAWHAAEEAEHRGTCHDIYVAAGGTYWVRVLTLLVAWRGMLWISLANTFMLLRRDGRLFRWDTLAGLWYLFGPRGLVTSLVPRLLVYLRPGFRPWDYARVHAADIRAWQERNAQYIVNLEEAEEPLAVA